MSFDAAAALGYIHAKHIARALASCGTDSVCTQRAMDQATPEDVVGFGGFDNHVAKFTMPILEFRDGKFVDVK